MSERITPGRRLWLTTDRDKLVEDGDPDAQFLYCTEDDDVDAKEAADLGFKAKPATSNKAKTPAENK